MKKNEKVVHDTNATSTWKAATMIFGSQYMEEYNPIIITRQEIIQKKQGQVTQRRKVI